MMDSQCEECSRIDWEDHCVIIDGLMIPEGLLMKALSYITSFQMRFKLLAVADHPG